LSFVVDCQLRTNQIKPNQRLVNKQANKQTNKEESKMMRLII
jgi:hypothetical protein